MRTIWSLLAFLLPGTLAFVSAAEPAANEFVPIFDGQTLQGWSGKPGFWRVENNALVGETTSEHPLDKNTFLVWEAGQVDDFELHLKFRISGTPQANSGIQFRGFQRADGHVVGYQADIDRAGKWTGALYDEAARGILAPRGEKARCTAGQKPVVEQIADPDELWSHVKIDDWNDYAITAQGEHITLRINGQITAEIIDQDPAGLDRAGVLALQLHTGPAMKIEFKDIRLKRLPLEQGWKKVVFIAGKPSHGYFAHEHNAGSLLLAEGLRQAQSHGMKMLPVVYSNGWPKDPTALQNADTVVAYCDGGTRHFLNEHLAEFDALVQSRGTGLVCLHYGVETVPGPAGEAFLKWIGGYFEPNWSVNPHWVADFKTLPSHPITQGVKPFSILDEWYYHMRFVPEMTGVTPILTALPPRETLNREDGPHSGNPFVREAVLERKEPQHMAWAYERPQGKGRGFGFTGGHFHSNWQDDNFRTLVLNAIVWTTGAEVPAQGVISKTPTNEEMEANQDDPRPKNFQYPPRTPATTPPVTSGPATTGPSAQSSTSQPAAAQSASKQPAAAQSSPAQAAMKPADPKPAYLSPVVSASTPDAAVQIDVEIPQARSLYLIVTGAGDGIGCDWAAWENPHLTGAAGKKDLSLTELNWKSATAEHGAVQVNRNVEGKSLKSRGRTIPVGIGVHALSIIEYELPENHGYSRFQAGGVLDDGGLNQGCGSTVQFAVFTEKPSRASLHRIQGNSNAPQHESTIAVEQLDVHPQLQATLFASEPMMSNPTSIDIDPLGRVWVCEGINYRTFRNEDVIGKNHAPDRILILQDTDGNGIADSRTVFYEGHDIDAAHGILVLPTPDGHGTRSLISCGDSVFFLIDDDGDLHADRKELLFTGISGVQHDHGIHAFHFGPDGKLYFNFGNYGQTIKDKHGQPIIDKAGNEVKASRQPYQEGMVFRCNLDGSGFETLAWNFRNNWEVCVDSFGTLWQSDNDDDGNQGVRINFVMEYGNYGYRDELTGASWQTPRTNWESEIPLRHWHLNDPGVVPNLLQTGAGAPTGICFYEGRLLPQELSRSIIHCDAGPNICRAYVPKPDGAGYTAQVVNLLNGDRNRWFRPSDVSIAPDGSLMVADWYDPGVGGHRMQDIEHGRIFRLAPASAAHYRIPAVDVSTPAGAALALQSPNMSTQYLAWTALQKFGKSAEQALLPLLNGNDPVMQARALWILTNLGLPHERLVQLVRQGLGSSDENVRMMSVRLVRQKLHELSFDELSGAITAHDPSAGVRREILIALREIPDSWYPEDRRATFPAMAWTKLATQYNGTDRWMLEALGISAAGHWDRNLQVWLKEVGSDWVNSKASRDIVWRSRAQQTPALLEQMILSPAVPLEELPRIFRAFDFQQGAELQKVLARLAFGPLSLPPQRVTLVRMEALSRVGNIDLQGNPQHRQALENVLKDLQGTERFIQLIRQFNLEKHYPELLQIAQTQPESQLAVDAIKTLFDKQQTPLIEAALTGDNRELAEKMFTAVGTVGDKPAVALLVRMLDNPQGQQWAHQAAIRALGASTPGAQILLTRAQKNNVPEGLRQVLAATLTSSSNANIRATALKLYPPPPGKNDAPLPPLTELAARTGDAAMGKIVFNTNGTCNKCHQVNGIGQEIGPNLSEIGKKLAKTALYEAIVYPSAAISHGFENWLVITEDGQSLSGLLISETDQEIAIKDEKGIVRKVPVQEIEARKKQETSLMPADLQRLMTTEELVDLVEYLTTLKERRQ